MSVSAQGVKLSCSAARNAISLNALLCRYKLPKIDTSFSARPYINTIVP